MPISYITQCTPIFPPSNPKKKTKLYDRILLRCFIVKKLISKNRSTQLAKHPSSPFSSFDPLMFPVTHFFQQIWVKLCVSAITQISILVSLDPSSFVSPPMLHSLYFMEQASYDIKARN